MTNTKTKKTTKGNGASKAGVGGERLPTPLWRLLKGLDDETLAKIEHVRKEMKTDWTGVVHFLLKKVQKPIKAAKPRKQNV